MTDCSHKHSPVTRRPCRGLGGLFFLKFNFFRGAAAPLAPPPPPPCLRACIIVVMGTNHRAGCYQARKEWTTKSIVFLKYIKICRRSQDQILGSLQTCNRLLVAFKALKTNYSVLHFTSRSCWAFLGIPTSQSFSSIQIQLPSGVALPVWNSTSIPKTSLA